MLFILLATATPDLMKNYFLLAACLVLTADVAAQHGSEKQVPARIAEHKAVSAFTRFTPFTPTDAPTLRDALVGPVVEDAAFMTASGTALAGILAQPPDHLTLEIPTADGLIALDLVRAEIHSTGFSLVTASTGAPVEHAPGVHYRGIIAGEPLTLAAISIFPDEVMGFVSDATGNHVLGKLEGSADEHIYYAERDLIDPPVLECATPDGAIQPERGPMVQGHAKTVRCVDLYWEVDHDIYLDKGDLTNTTNYITGLFNQHATLFDNDGISVLLSELFIWDVASPYTGNTTNTMLSQFRAFHNGFNGDVGHLIGYRGAGGLAVFDGLCDTNPDDRMCYSSIYGHYASVPVYSYSVTVVTHEEGHVMGSPHTHACAWNGNNTAIDGCGPAGGHPYEGTCFGAPIPAIGGTVMSYCHLLTAVGINFTHGFGPQPTALIVGKINDATCLGACGTAGCDLPTDLTSDALANSATLSWAAVSGAISYTLQWKPSTTAMWTTVAGITGTDHVVDGLLATVAYNYRVRTECVSGSSVYSPVHTFTTPCTFGAGCEDGDPLTGNDIIIADCVCAGVPLSPLEQINKIVAGDRSTNAEFGSSVAINGDYAIVGAPQAASGKVYIFMRIGTTWVQQQQLLVSDASGADWVGCSVAIDGDYAIVGALKEDLDEMGGNAVSNAGCAYIFMRSGNVWIEQQKLVASDRATSDEFGGSVAISGDHAIVGARFEDHDATGGSESISAGSAYIFVRNGDTWTQQAKIVASDRNSSDEFGGSVAISGDHAIVGARFEDHDATNGAPFNSAGSAYIFVRSGDTWTQQQKIVASDRNTEDEFGASVAISGDHAIVGAPFEDHNASGGASSWKAGSAYIFARYGDIWIQQQKIVASDRDLSDEFGWSVAISGDRAIIGAHHEDDGNSNPNYNIAGAAYVFVRGGGVWAQHQKLRASDRALGDRFGASVAISSDHVIVGARTEDEDEFGNNTIGEAGSAYLFAEADISTGLDPAPTTTELLVFPVPTCDVLNVLLPDTRAYLADVIGLDGRLILPLGAMRSRTHVDVSTLTSGAYLLRLTSATQGVRYVRFLKE